MPRTDRTASRGLLRLARRIHDRLQDVGDNALSPLPDYEWQRLQQLSRLLELARRRRSSDALPRLRREYARMARTLIHHVEDQLRTLDELSERRPLASLPDILNDLQALEEEFGGLALDLKAGTFSVTTEPVTLEGIDLGPFRIVVHLACLGEASPYEVVALEPNPASESSDTVHPHVQGESLCEGDGRTAIRRASEQGRIFDLCMIVRQILQTYHSGSAYVPLSRWYGKECSDCGEQASRDESTWCERCETDLCRDCAESCGVCAVTLCASCRSPCPGCESRCCTHCLTRCADCEDTFCSECLTEGRCPSCHEAWENPDEETLEEPAAGDAAEIETTDAAGPAVQSLGVGQVPVPA